MIKTIILKKIVSKNIFFDNKKKIFLDNNKFWQEIKKNNLNITGNFSAIKNEKNFLFLARDLSGCRKIFYSLVNNKFYISSNFVELKKKVVKLNLINSVPKGSVIIFNKNNQKIKFKKLKINSPIRNYSSYIKKNILLYLTQLKKIHGNNCVVCLSGGLDSTIIAYLASKVFKNLKLVNIKYLSKKKSSKIQFYDSNKAKEIADYLNLKLITLKIKEEDILKNLNKILYSCQDYRDYNVHCATLNFFIAKYFFKKNFFFLTGDFMNEYFADYTPEKFKGKIYYKNPKVPINKLKFFFMNSLDTSDREIGVFNYFKLCLYQPYSFLYDFFYTLKINLNKNKKIKYKFNSKLLPKNLFNIVLKEKKRAQVGDSSGGLLGAFVNNGLSQDILINKFSKTFYFLEKDIKKIFFLGSYNF